MKYDDKVAGRKGVWMLTLSGRQFFPQDPRPEDFTIDDLANGLAKDERYGGQLPIEISYTTAEHSCLMARAGEWEYRLDGRHCLLILLHDAAEGLLRDLPYSVKRAVNGSYKRIESRFEEVIFEKYGVLDLWRDKAVRELVKEIDNRIVPLEKELHAHQLPWAKDIFEPLKSIKLCCWERDVAKSEFLEDFDYYGGYDCDEDLSI